MCTHIIIVTYVIKVISSLLLHFFQFKYEKYFNGLKHSSTKYLPQQNKFIVENFKKSTTYNVSNENYNKS